MTISSSEPELHRLLYSSRFSKTFPTSKPAQDAEIAKIIRISVQNNRANAITGLLLVHQDCFLQALEGPSSAVMATYTKIAADPRHDSTTILSIEKTTDRSFPHWNMCAERLSDVDDAILRAFDRSDSFKPHSFSAATAFHLLHIVAATISVHRLGQQEALPALRQEITRAR